MSEKAGFGALLKEKRLASGMTVEALSAKTRINRSMLEALEAEDYDKLPSPVYVISFLRTCAAELKLDFAGLERMYLEYSGIDRSKFYFGIRTVKEEKTEETRMKRLYYYLAIFTALAVFLIYVFENMGVYDRLFGRRDSAVRPGKFFEISSRLEVSAEKQVIVSVSNRGLKILEETLSAGTTGTFNLIQGYTVRLNRPQNAEVYFKNRRIDPPRKRPSSGEAVYIVGRNPAGKLVLLPSQERP